MIKKLTRQPKREVERELWGRAAARCEISGCNKLLLASPLTQASVTIAEKAHIYSFSSAGPRGHGPHVKNDPAINEAANLILVCNECHIEIDSAVTRGRYPADLLKAWKRAHEHRVEIVTGVDPTRKSHVVLYGANIGEQSSRLQPNAAIDALFPDWYPAEQRPIQLSMAWQGDERHGSYWPVEQGNLISLFDQRVRPLIKESDICHFSVFALAPIPLLIKLGALFTDKIPVEVFQLHREPPTWRWVDERDFVRFSIDPPDSIVGPPALVISLSDTIAHERVLSVLGNATSIWEITIPKPDPDFLRTRNQLSDFRACVRTTMIEIAKAHGRETALPIFPAMPVACSVELGRVRMPKVDPVWILYDHYNNRFNPTINIGPNDDDFA